MEVISLVRSKEVKCASQDEFDDLLVIFYDTGMLTLHDNSVGLRVGTQETLAEHRLERVESTSKIGNNFTSKFITSRGLFGEQKIYLIKDIF